MGGMLRAIERGWVQQEIQNAAYKQQQQVDSGEAVVVGVNRFTQETEVRDSYSDESTRTWSASK
jgi:methylmalonyl-CoA mutase N-terminal domain/subunit